MPEFADGVWWCDLSPVTHPAYVPQSAASVLRLTASPNRSLLDVVTEAWHSRHALLILDNCEHVLSGCAGPRSIHRELMRCLACQGETSQAGRHYRTLSRLLLFMKEAAGRITGLLVIAATDDQQKETSVFFLRANGVQGTPTPLKESRPAPAAGPLPTLAPAQDTDGDGRIGVCEIIPQAVLEEAMGRALTAPGQPFSDAALGEGCAYDFGRDSSAAYFAYVTLASEQQFNNALANAVQAEPVTTIGDSAFLHDGPDARQLWVRAGGKAALVAIGDRENIPAAMLFARYLVAFAQAGAGNGKKPPELRAKAHAQDGE